MQYALLNFHDARVEAWCTLHMIKLNPRALSPTNTRNPLRGVDAASKCRGGPHARARLYESRRRFFDPFFLRVIFVIDHETILRLSSGLPGNVDQAHPTPSNFPFLASVFTTHFPPTNGRSCHMRHLVFSLCTRLAIAEEE